MFKIDWPCAIGGALIGYYTKGKVESTKAVVKKISTDAMDSLKESFSDYERPQATQQPQAPRAPQGNVNGNGN